MIRNNNTSLKKTTIKDNSLTLHQILEPTEMKLITIDSIFEKYPFVKTEMGWTEANIRIFLESYLILGVKKEGVFFVDTESFEKLIEYHRKVNKSKN